MMLRTFVLVMLVACGGPTIHLEKADLAVQEHRRGPVHFIGFVNTTGSVVDSEAAADFALQLPGGDWLAEMNGKLVRLSSNGRIVRWAKPGLGVWDAVAGPEGRVICAGTIADPAALNGAGRHVFMLDIATGDVVWHAEAPPITSGARARVARVGTTTVAVSAYGPAAFDDSGKVLWVVKDPESGSDDPWIAPLADAVLVLSMPQRLASDFTGGAPLHRPLVVRTFDIASGALRGQFDLAADADYIYAQQLGFTGDGRIALLAGDIRENVEPMMRDGQRMMVHRSDSTPKLIELDVHDTAKPSARATPIAIPKTIDPMPAALAPSEVAFVDGYASDGEALGLVIVSLQSPRVRRAAIMTSDKRSSHVQLMHIAAHRDSIIFAGHFTGHAKPLEGRVETVDWCEAQHGVECFGEHEDPTLAPYAALIGTVAR